MRSASMASAAALSHRAAACSACARCEATRSRSSVRKPSANASMAVPRPFSTPRGGSPTPGAWGRASRASSRFSKVDTRSPSSPCGKRRAIRPSIWSTRRSRAASRSAGLEGEVRDPSTGVTRAGLGEGGSDSLTSIFPRPFDSTVSMAPSCRRFAHRADEVPRGDLHLLDVDRRSTQGRLH